MLSFICNRMWSTSLNIPKLFFLPVLQSIHHRTPGAEHCYLTCDGTGQDSCTSSGTHQTPATAECFISSQPGRNKIIKTPPNDPWQAHPSARGGEAGILRFQAQDVQLVAAERGKCPPVPGTLMPAVCAALHPWLSVQK